MNYRGEGPEPTRPVDWHGHSPDVMTDRKGKGGNASLGLPASGKSGLNKVRASAKGNAQRRRNKRH